MVSPDILVMGKLHVASWIANTCSENWAVLLTGVNWWICVAASNFDQGKKTWDINLPDLLMMFSPRSLISCADKSESWDTTKWRFCYIWNSRKNSEKNRRWKGTEIIMIMIRVATRWKAAGGETRKSRRNTRIRDPDWNLSRMMAYQKC